MGPALANLVYLAGIAGLFYLDRDSSIRTSKALWLPVFWLLIVGSRPVSVWLNGQPPHSASALLDGSPLDRMVFSLLLAAGLVVVISRSRRVFMVLMANWPVILFFTFCLFSVLWSDFPDVAFKRWTKAIADLVMVLIIVTDTDPVGALKRFFSRTGFILLPLSVLMIKYYDGIGRGYDPWYGTPVNFGVTTDKNALGVITFILGLAALWRVLTLLQSREQPNRGRHLLAQGALLGISIMLLEMANSATSIASFILGAVLLLATGIPVMKRHPAFVHVFVLSLVLIAGLVMFMGGEGSVVHALGRNTTLTGRTDIWKLVLPMATNAWVGAGFESFWLGPRLERLWLAIPNLYLNEAHDGYIETYLNLGYVGVGLIALILINGYRRSVGTFRRNPALGGLFLAYVLSSAIYNVTEAGFRMLYPMWIFILLAALAAGATAQRANAELTLPLDGPTESVLYAPAGPARMRS